MIALATLIVPVLVAVFAMQMERFESYCTHRTRGKREPLSS